MKIEMQVGFYVDIIEYIAEQEGWTLQFVPCTWQECQDFLADGSIDLLMSVAYTEERAQKFDFTSEFVFNNWAYIYRKPGSQIESVLDLEGKKVAGVRGNVYTEGFREMLQSFDIESEVVEVDDYPDMFRLLDVGVVDAGVANRVNGLKYESQFDVEKTSIIFHPIELLFATPKGKHSEIREAIDRHMVELKADKDSLYYQSLNNWLGIEQVAVFPDWVKWSLGFGIGALGLLLTFIYTLRS